MACYDTSPYTCTYDSGGAGSLPGGGSPDYSSLSTWESASDNDLAGYSGPVVLDCYDSQDHADRITISGGANVSPTVYREIRSSSNCAVPWAGRKGTGANFIYVGETYNLGLFYLGSESYARVRDIYGAVSANNSSERSVFFCTAAACKFINCVATGVNAGSGVSHGFNSQGNVGTIFYNCVALNCKSHGFYLYNSGHGDSAAVVNCVAIGNGDTGFYGYSAYADSRSYCWSCYAANNTTADFRETTQWRSPSGWNASKDNTADLGGAAGDNYKNGLDLITAGKMDSDGLALADDLYANGDAGDRYGRNPYNDLSSVIDFDDFLKNDAAGEAISRLDIRGTARPNGTSADSSWNVGASQAITSSTITLTVADLTSGASLDGITVSPLLLEQEGFRFRNDDGSESAATWLANQDVSVELQPGDKVRLRFVINGSGDYGPAQFQLEYKKTTEGEWLRLVP